MSFNGSFEKNNNDYKKASTQKKPMDECEEQIKENLQIEQKAKSDQKPKEEDKEFYKDTLRLDINNKKESDTLSRDLSPIDLSKHQIRVYHKENNDFKGAVEQDNLEEISQVKEENRIEGVKEIEEVKEDVNNFQEEIKDAEEELVEAIDDKTLKRSHKLTN
jgi:hypothetical protein